MAKSVRTTNKLKKLKEGEVIDLPAPATKQKIKRKVSDKTKRKISDETKRKIAEGQKKRWAEKKANETRGNIIERVDQATASHIPLIGADETADYLKVVDPNAMLYFEHEPIRVGDMFIYDVRIEDIGWRRWIIPTEWDKFFSWDREEVSEAEYFGITWVSHTVILRRGIVWSLRAKAYIPVEELVYSPWVIRQGLRIGDTQTSRQTYDNIMDKIAGSETKGLLGVLQNQQMLLLNYKIWLEKADTNISALAEDYATKLFDQWLKGQRPHATILQLSRILDWVKRNKLNLLALILVTAAVALFWYIITSGMIG